MERAVVLSTGNRIGTELIPDNVSHSAGVRHSEVCRSARGHFVQGRDRERREAVDRSTLEAAGGVQKRAAELLKIKRRR